MSDIVQTLAAHTGIDQATIEKAVGSILGALKTQLSTETYSQIEDKIPGSPQMVSGAMPEKSGSLIETASQLAGKLLGTKVQGGFEMVEQINKLGISPSSFASIVTSLFKFLSDHLPPEVMAQIVKALPTIPGLSLTSAGLTNESSSS
jgi:uncharacterized protein (DUF2267 family)